MARLTLKGRLPTIECHFYKIGRLAFGSPSIDTWRECGHNNVTMKAARNTIPAGQFKARCLGLLDQVAESGETLVITKRGKPVAKLVPVKQTPSTSLKGSVQYLGEIVGPLGEKWEADL